MNMDDVTLIHGDCLAEMPRLPSASFDMICADLPYGTTACSWDVVIPFEPLWAEYKRLIKPRGAIVLFGAQPFTSLLVCSNLAWFKYAWVWVKNTSSGMMRAGKSPMRRHEDIVVFGNGEVNFNPQKVLGSLTSQNHARKGYTYSNRPSKLYNVDGGKPFVWSEYVNPHSVLPCDSVGNRDRNRKHPAQKPTPLLEYFIRTYSNEGDAVLDNTMGSGTTMVACIQTGRRGTGIELRRDYFEIAEERCRKSRLQPPLRPNNGFHPSGRERPGRTAMKQMKG